MASRNGKKPPDPRYIPKQHGRKPSSPVTARKHHGKKPAAPKPNADACCPMVAAVRSARRGRFRLARRYAAWSVRLLVARMVAA